MNKQSKKTELDEEIFSKIANGDDEAFTELYYLTYKQIYGFLLSLTKNKEDAEDLMQNTFIRIRNGANLYKKNGTPMAWMCTIAKNQYLDYVRKYGKYREIDYDLIENQMPYSTISDADNRLVLQTAFEHLSEDERTIVIMHLVNGLKHREIAQIVNIPLSTVLSKYNRSLKKMKVYLEG